MQVQDVMTRGVAAVGQQTIVREAAMRMRQDNIGSIPIVEDGRLLGVLTDRDIAVRVVAEADANAEMPVRDVMSKGAYTVHEDDDIGAAAELMARHQVRRLPVVDREEHLVGMVSLADLAQEAPEAGKEALTGISEPLDAGRRRQAPTDRGRR